MTLFSGVCSANSDVTLPRLVVNQMSRERVVGRGGGGKMAVAFREDSKEGQSVRAQFGVGRGGPKQGGLKAEEDRDMVRFGRGKAVGPLCEIWCKERAGKSEIQDARSSNE